MNYLILFVLVVSSVSATPLPEAPDRKENAIVLEVVPSNPRSDHREKKTDLEDQNKSFEIVVPVKRTFSSLKELWQILREDEQEPQDVPRTPQEYVKGTETNSSGYMIFFTDGLGGGGSG